MKQTSYEEEKAECAAFEASIDSAITQDQQSIDDNTKNIVNLQNQLDGFKSDLVAAEELQQSKQDQIDSIDAIREEENASYQAAVAELNQMIQALRDGKAILQRLLASNSNAGMFFEKNKILDKPSKEQLHGVISLLQTPIKNGYLKMGTLLFEMIAKQDGEVDQTLLNNVLDLIDQLIAQLIDNRQTKSNTEEARKTAYDQERNSLESALVVVGSSIDNIKSTIKGINDQLLDLNADNIDLADKVATNQADKADKEQECSDYYHAYLAESQNRFLNFYGFFGVWDKIEKMGIIVLFFLTGAMNWKFWTKSSISSRRDSIKWTNTSETSLFKITVNKYIFEN